MKYYLAQVFVKKNSFGHKLISERLFSGKKSAVKWVTDEFNEKWGDSGTLNCFTNISKIKVVREYVATAC